MIGKDTRLSGYMIKSALVSGFTAVGMDVFQLGPMRDLPAVAMLTRSLRADLGVMISASHNPFVDNGIKLFGPDGYKLSDEKEEEIEQLMEGDAPELLATPDLIGRATRIDSARERYIEFAKRTLPKNIRFDGQGGDRLRQRRWLQGGARSAVGTRGRGHQDRRRPEWLNINKDCARPRRGSDPQGQRSARRYRHRARRRRRPVVIVDEKGRIIDGDQLMAVIGVLAEARAARRRRHRRHGDVQSRARALFGNPRPRHGPHAVGDRYVVEYMRQHGYNVGGEQSGHIVLSDFSTTGDGLVTALQLLSVVAQSGKPVSEICNRFEPLPQILKNVRYKTASRSTMWACSGGSTTASRTSENGNVWSSAVRGPSP